MEDSGDPGPQSEATPQIPTPTFGPGRSRCGICALGLSSLCDIQVSERLWTWLEGQGQVWGEERVPGPAWRQGKVLRED